MLEKLLGGIIYGAGIVLGQEIMTEIGKSLMDSEGE